MRSTNILNLLAWLCVATGGHLYAQAPRSEELDKQSIPQFWLHQPSNPVLPPYLKVRGNADAVLEVNAQPVVAGTSVQAASPVWNQIQAAIAEYVVTAGRFKKLHVRFYHSDHARTGDSTSSLHAEIKKVLADLPIYVVVTDETVRNDKLPWDEYLKQWNPQL